MRQVAALMCVAALVGLVPVELAALILAAMALVVAVTALGVASAVRRSFHATIDRQTTVSEELVSRAEAVEEKIRDGGD